MTDFHPAEPRETIRVTLRNGKFIEGPINATTNDFLHAAITLGLDNYDSPLMGAIVDGKLRELSYPLQRDVTLEPVTLSTSDGGRIYRRSLVMLMVTAAAELFPDTHISVRYAVPDGGFYCAAVGRKPFSKEELTQIAQRMREIVAADEPITKKIVSIDEAKALFESRQEFDKMRLLEQRERDDLTLYELRGRADYYYGYMLPSTGALQYFRMIEVEDGFILQYPRKEHPTQLQEIRAYEKLGRVFHQTDEWLHKMDVEDMGKLNQLVRAGRVRELILVHEALHEQNVAAIATEIVEQYNQRGARLVLIAGPSSSGKTTFAKRLAIQILAHGLHPFTLEMDNYFVDREKTPRDENGDYDFESLQALDLDYFNQQLVKLIEGKEVQLPRFDFIEGKRKAGRKVKIEPNQLIILEGIHGLNPDLVPNIPPEWIFRVYVSALTQLNIDNHNRVPTTDVRLLRRIVRDARTRGYTATDTLQRWQSVRRGEKRNIFPYQENADMMFNSALVYELAVLRSLAEPLLLQVVPGTPPHIEANRLLSFLRWVHPLPQEAWSMIPDTSLLREFIGGSVLEDYHPGVLLEHTH
ncbi:MAG: nucleoside kinase [Chloroflexi bacterium]|nr:MAG: nucleoside kinase [Chloroflexota bacterium]